jgi:hypothetical protein
MRPISAANGASAPARLMKKSGRSAPALEATRRSNFYLPRAYTRDRAGTPVA